MRKLLNIAEIFMYGLAVYNLSIGKGEMYWVWFGVGLAISFFKRFFK